MPKEKSFNPAAAQRKADKKREISKSKKQLQTQRNEKLARRNPERLQRQIDELKALEQRAVLRPKDKETLAQLERDLKGVQRAREALGEQAPQFKSYERQDPAQKGGVKEEQQARRQRQFQHQQPHLGKRRRDEDNVSDTDIDPEILSIPMPRDTPPPFPRQAQSSGDNGLPEGSSPRAPHPLPNKPSHPPSKKIYTSEPQIRDLKKEAVQFMPSVVAAQKQRLKGQGRLLEPDEVEKLEKAGYVAAQKASDEAALEARFKQVSSEVRADAKHGTDLDEEAKRFEEEIDKIYPTDAEELNVKSETRSVQIEDVEDEGD